MVQARNAQHDFATPLARAIWLKRMTRGAIGAALCPPVSTSTVSRWASGDRAISPARRKQLATVLGVAERSLQ